MKAKRRQTRETRAAYRTRKRQGRTKPVSHTQVPVVPWEERIAPTDEQLEEWNMWLNDHEPEFEEKYPGQYLAIWDKKVISVASSRFELYAQVDRTQPKIIPLITFVPGPHEIFFAPSNFPVEWLKLDDKQSR